MFKKKKQIKSVTIKLIDERTGGVSNQKTYQVPENGSIRIETIGGDFIVYDKDKNIVNHVRWQAGFTQEYTYNY